MMHSGPHLVTLCHLMTFPGAKRPDSGLFWASKWLVCSKNGPLRASEGGTKDQKWASDTCFANIGQLDHNVVFGTKFGAVQGFQRGKKCPKGFKQTPLDPLDPPKPPQWPSIQPIKFLQLSYNSLVLPKPPKNAKNVSKMQKNVLR